MSYIKDLESVPGTDSKLKVIGWLDKAHPYTQGDVSSEFFLKLATLLVDPWQPAISTGRHRCDLCRFSGGPQSVSVGEVTVFIGSVNLYVPGGGVVYFAPSTLIHYVDSHGYCPPREFQQAVLDCAPMRSISYFKALITNGPKGLVSKPS